MDERPIPRGEDLLAHGRFLRALARSLVLDPQRADDLVQETWAAALESPPRHGAALGSWLARILRNLSITAGLREGERAAREAQAARPEAAWTGTAAGEEADAPDGIAAELEVQRQVFECVQRL